MPWFRCLARGKNFQFRDESDGEWKAYGFYTTRWVEAADAAAAEPAALAVLRSDIKSSSIPDDRKSKSAQVFFEEIELCAKKPKSKGGGFVFYLMTDADEEGNNEEALAIEAAAASECR